MICSKKRVSFIRKNKKTVILTVFTLYFTIKVCNKSALQTWQMTGMYKKLYFTRELFFSVLISS